MITWIHFDVKKFWSLGLYLIFSFLRFAVTYRRWKCICFSIFRGLQSLPGAEFVSAFLLFPICSHFGNPGVYLFFLFLAICGHFRIHECICFSLFCNLQSLLVPGIVSYFLLLVICSHILTPEMYLHFSFSRFAVTYRRQKAMSKAWWVTKKTQQKTIFSPDAAGFFRQ